MTALAVAIIACWSISIAPEARRAKPCTRCHAILSDGVHSASGGVSPEPHPLAPLPPAPDTGRAARRNSTPGPHEADRAAQNQSPNPPCCHSHRPPAGPGPRRAGRQAPWPRSTGTAEARRCASFSAALSSVRSLENIRLAFAAPVASAMARRNSSATASASNALPARRAVRYSTAAWPSPYVVAKLATPAAAPPIRVPYPGTSLASCRTPNCAP